jgi:hypothetical protein
MSGNMAQLTRAGIGQRYARLASECEMTLSLIKRLFSGIMQHTPLGAATTERTTQKSNHIVVGTKKSSALRLLNFPVPGMPCLIF